MDPKELPRRQRATSEPPAADGTQALRRGVAVLKAIARANASQLSLAQVARMEGLPRSTAHRILHCLVDEGLVERSADGRHYQLGELTHELGMVPTAHAAAIERWRDLVEAVARRTTVTAYLMRRQGLDAVCLLKAEGRAVVRVVPVEVGQRRALGLGAGSIALLAAQEDAVVEEAARILATHADGGLQPAFSRDGLWLAVQHARASGFAISQSKVAEESFGMGMVIPEGDGPPRLALSIAAHNSVVTESGIARWKRDMLEEASRARAGLR